MEELYIIFPSNNYKDIDYFYVNKNVWMICMEVHLIYVCLTGFNDKEMFIASKVF